MRNFPLVFKHELRTLVLRKSFLLVLVLVPLVPFIIMTVASGLGVEQSSAFMEELLVPEEQEYIEGFVDHSGLVEEIPEELFETLLAFESEADAERAMEDGDIQSWLVIEADYLESGLVKQYNAPVDLLGSLDGRDKIDALMAYNLLDGDMQAYSLLESPMVVETEILAVTPQHDPKAAMTFLLPYIITFFFFFEIYGSASMLLSSVAREKENYMLEELLTSLSPIELIAGKIAAGGVAGLLQTVVWLACSYGLLRMSGQQFGLAEEFMLPTSTLLWGVVFFLLGYAIYASLMAGVGAVVPSVKETTQYTVLISTPIIACLLTFFFVISKPHSVFSVVMSLFPFTAPVMMMTRLTAAFVPLWQLLLAIVVMVLTVVWIVVSVSRLFHARFMLADEPLKIKHFVKAFFGKA
jgi:ABC-2 type transport system permease protein